MSKFILREGDKFTFTREVEGFKQYISIYFDSIGDVVVEVKEEALPNFDER